MFVWASLMSLFIFVNISWQSQSFTDAFAGDVVKGEHLRSDMKGAILNISVVITDFLLYDTYAVVEPSGKVKLHPCLAYELLAVLQISMNFTPSFIPTDHWGFYDHQKSEWQGMIGHLVQNKTDLALASSVETPQRHSAVDFNLNYDVSQLVALYRNPDLNNDEFALLRPFSPPVWLTVGGFSISLVLALLFLSSVHGRYNAWNANCLTNSARSQTCQPSDCIFWPVQFICSKSIYVVPQAGSIRVVVLVGWFATVVLNVGYSGTLISFLKVATGGFTRFEQLLQTSFTFDTRPDPTFQMLKESSSPSVIKAVRRIREKPLYSEVFHARQKLLGGSYVFMTHDLPAYDGLTNDFNEHDRCLIHDLIIPVQNPKSGTMVRKKSPLKRIIDYQIIKAKQFGLNQCWLKRYIPKRPVCLNKTAVGVPLRSVLVAICTLISGFLASLAALIVEIVFSFYAIRRFQL